MKHALMRVHWRIGVRFALRIIRSNRLTAVIYTHVLRVDKKSPRPVGVGRGQKRQPFRLREEKVVRLTAEVNSRRLLIVAYFGCRGLIDRRW